MKKTEKLIVDITFKLLYTNGYHATGLTEILEQANMTKGAMYYHFKSKHDLVLSTITYYSESMLNDNWIEPFNDSSQPIEALINQINAYKDMFANKKHFLNVKHGCPIGNFVSDMSDMNDELFTYLKEVYLRWQESFEKVLTKAQTLGQTATKFDSKKQAFFIISSIEGSISSAKAVNDFVVLEDSLAILTNYIKKL